MIRERLTVTNFQCAQFYGTARMNPGATGIVCMSSDNLVKQTVSDAKALAQKVRISVMSIKI